ncbi:hypothetical protein AMTRI_Chr12g242070 [Amborella trichopoda]
MSSQFDGSSLFGGGGFMPFESTQSTQHSPSSSRGRGVSALLPCTVKQLSRIFAGDSSSIGIDAIESDTIRLVGMVVKKDERVTDVQFALDDGTGKIDVHRCAVYDINILTCASHIFWVILSGSMMLQLVKRWKWCSKNGKYIRVICQLKSFQAKRHAEALSVRPVTDFNEVTCHFLECCYVHMHNTRHLGGSSQPQTSSVNIAHGNGPLGHGTPIQAQFSGRSAPVGSDEDICNRVRIVFMDPAALENDGLHVDEAARRLPGIPKERILKVIGFLADEGEIYSTINESVYRSAVNG